MNIKIKNGLKEQSIKVRNHAGSLPYFYALGGMVLLALLYFGFVLINSTSNIWLYVLGFAIIIGYMFVGLPLLYGVSVLTSNATRFNDNTELSLRTCFDKYFHGNPGFFSTAGIIFKGILLDLFSLIVVMYIMENIADSIYPEFAARLIYIYQNADILNFSTISTLMQSYSSVFEAFYIISMVVGHIPLFVLVSSELRKNESVYYAANVLVSDNYLDVATRPLIPLFRREILPLVRKEYRAYNLRLNYLGYIVFYLVYLGVSALGLFFTGISFIYVPFIAFAVAIIFYAPFYYRQRVFDALFYIAYSDKIMNRASDKIKQIINAGRSQIMHKVDEYKEKNDIDTSDDEFEDFDSEIKKGQYDPYRNEFDFTEEDDNHKNNDED
ncbi:MAG: hypothetical protein WCR63_03540 [Bacilli bacterium]